MSWGYDSDNGPENWWKNFPIAKGSRQSPIDIKPENAEFNQKLVDSPLKVSYVKEKNIDCCNTGMSVKVQAAQKDSLISGGPLNDIYRLEQFHFHWGSDDTHGSEHTVNGKEYASEVHLVHYNTKYGTFGNAADKSDGLAVLGFFISIGEKHAGLNEFTDAVYKISEKDEHCTIDNFDMSCLLCGDMTRYWTYEGSLTTPPLYESVQWIVFKKPITMSEKQLGALRTLKFGCDRNTHDKKEKNIVDNFRPPVPLGDRTVYASFQS